MSDPADVLFYIEGEQAESTAGELQALVEALFQQTPRREPPAGDRHPQDKAGGWEIAGVILAIPSGIVATLDLAERLALKEKIQRLIVFAQQARQGQGTGIRLKRRNRLDPLPLDEARLSELLDQFTPIP